MKFDKTAILNKKRFMIKFKSKEQLYCVYGSVKLCIMEDMATSKIDLDGLGYVLDKLAWLYDRHKEEDFPTKFDMSYAEWRTIWNCGNVVLQNALIPDIKAVDHIEAIQKVLAERLDRLDKSQKHVEKFAHIQL